MNMLQRYTKQEIYEGTESYRNIGQVIKNISYHKILVVCGRAFKNSVLSEYFERENINYCIYDAFQPNPTYENILDGLKVFKENNCDFLISVGGGSAIDTAKCIKAYVKMDTQKEYVDQEITDSGIYHLAMPTTAGTGSESTQFAVMYYKSSKMSVSHACLLPNCVILEPSLLATLPDYQKKATLLDALCQATESFWSVKSNDISRAYAAEAISIILKYAKPYIHANERLIEIYHAANLAGRAINITQTTLAHAMSYKLTSLYGISHGHAVAICMPYVWEYLTSGTDKMQEGRSSEEMETLLAQLNDIYHCQKSADTISLFRGMLLEFGLEVPKYSEEDLDILADSVNAERMKNYPVCIEKEQLREMYAQILSDKDKHSVSCQLQFNTAGDMRELEELSELKQNKILGMEVREGAKTLRVEAAGRLLEAILAYADIADSAENEAELEGILSELIISLNGYPLENEVDTINYENASDKLKNYPVLVSEEEKTAAAKLAAAHGITVEHGLVLCRFIKVCRMFKQNAPGMASVFGILDSTANIYILRGMLYQFNLLVKGNKEFRKINRPSQYTKAHEYVLYWKNIQLRFYNKKYGHYLKELNKVQLEMMDEIARVCDKHNLKYVLNYGSLLGAVRHKGFIPWDDDLDICMPREDYEKFLEIGRKELGHGCYLYNNQDFNDCWFSMMKVMKKDTVFVRHPYRFGEEDGQRIFIDVWPLDNVMGPEETSVKRMKKRKSILTRMLRLKIKARCGGALSFTQKCRNIILLPLSEQTLKRMREKNVTQWRNRETDYWMSGGVYDYIKETMPKSWYIPTATLPYEGHEYKFPGKWDEVLKHFYGNYMQVPPLDKRYTHAPFKVCMGQDGEVLYFNETQHRGRKSLRTRLKRKIRKFFRIAGEKLNPVWEAVNYAAVLAGGVFRTAGIAISKNSKRLKSYKNRYNGQTCYIIMNSSSLNEQEIEVIKCGISFAADRCYRILDEKNWHPDFYCVGHAEKDDKIPKAVLDAQRTELFYTKRAAKGRKARLKSGIRVPYRTLGKAPEKRDSILEGYYDIGAGNLPFMLELAAYMGFSKMILVGAEGGYATYRMNHFAETESFADIDMDCEEYLITMKRYSEIKKKLLSDKTEIIEYDSLKIN